MDYRKLGRAMLNVFSAFPLTIAYWAVLLWVVLWAYGKGTLIGNYLFWRFRSEHMET